MELLILYLFALVLTSIALKLDFDYAPVFTTGFYAYYPPPYLHSTSAKENSNWFLIEHTYGKECCKDTEQVLSSYS